MFISLRTLTSGAAVAFALTACANGDANGPLSAEGMLNADVALLAADGVAEDMEMMGGPAGLHGMGLFGMPGGPLAARDFGCRELDRPALTVTRTCTFADAVGGVQPGYDAATTASIRIETLVDGERAHDRWSASITRGSDMTVTGLAGEETQRSWNGNGSETTTRSQHADGETQRAYSTEGSVTITNVVVPVPRSPANWPLSGTIVRSVSGAITAGPRTGETFSRTVTTTFNGTQFATMTVGDESFTVDLRARRAARRR